MPVAAPMLRLACHCGIVRRCIRSAGVTVSPAPPLFLLDGLSVFQSLWRFLGGISYAMMPPSPVFAHVVVCVISAHPQTVLAPMPSSLPPALLLWAQINPRVIGAIGSRRLFRHDLKDRAWSTGQKQNSSWKKLGGQPPVRSSCRAGGKPWPAHREERATPHNTRIRSARGRRRALVHRR